MIAATSKISEKSEGRAAERWLGVIVDLSGILELRSFRTQMKINTRLRFKFDAVAAPDVAVVCDNTVTSTGNGNLRVNQEANGRVERGGAQC
jgi:hypothetical protein